MHFKKLTLLFFVFILSCSNAQACPMMEPLTDEQMLKAQSVFIGTAMEYESNDAPHPDVITFRVEEVLSGKPVSRDIKVNWIHGTFGMPSSIEEFRSIYGKKTKVGILYKETFPEECSIVNSVGERLSKEYCHSRFLGYKSPSDLPWIMNGGCTGPYMFPIE